MTQAVDTPPPQPPEVPDTPSTFGTSSRDILTVAGYGLTVYGIYNLVINLLSGGGGVDVVITRITQLVALFPVLLLGPTLLYSAQPMARRATELRHVLMRWLVLVIALSYLAFVPISFFTQYSFDRTSENAVRRLQTSMEKRRAEIIRSVADASTPDQFRVALSQFPEVSAVTINSADSPAQIRAGILTGINQGIKTQMDQAAVERQNRITYLAALVRTAALGSLVSGVAMMALALRIVPWLEPLGQSITRTGTGLAQGFGKLFRKRPTASKRPSPFQGLQKGMQNMQRSFQRTLRRQAERRRMKASAKRSSQRR